MNEIAERSRLDLIVQMLKINTSASIGEIAETFHVSQMTIRRDLEKLVEAGQVIRIPGGARIEHWRGAERSFFERLQKMSSAKRSIGTAAAALVSDGESVVLDSGTTTLYVARELRARRNVVVFTFSLAVLEELTSAEGIRVELTGGVFRYAMMSWYKPFAKEVAQPGAEFFTQHWGWFTCVFGILGGFAAGLISDRMFQSRRGPPTAMLCGFVLITATVMSLVLFTQPMVVGWSAVFIVMASIGVTSLMSGTAATDFGGRKATATSMGIINGFAYIGSGIQSFFIGYLVPSETVGNTTTFFGITRDWHWWPVFVIPFAVVGLACTIKIWHDLPEATRRYNKSLEDKDPPLVL